MTCGPAATISSGIHALEEARVTIENSALGMSSNTGPYCCAGGSLAFHRATDRALACDPRRSTGHAKGSGVPRRHVSAWDAARDPHRLERRRTAGAIVTAAGKESVDLLIAGALERQRCRKPQFPGRRRAASGEAGALFAVTFDASADRSESISQDRGDHRFL